VLLGETRGVCFMCRLDILTVFLQPRGEQAGACRPKGPCKILMLRHG
jgi:hypothetical protein